MDDRAQMVVMLFVCSASLTWPSEAPSEQLPGLRLEPHVEILVQPLSCPCLFAVSSRLHAPHFPKTQSDLRL